MSTYVHRAVSEVSVDPEPTSTSSEPDDGNDRWKAFDQMKSQRDRCHVIELRTRSEGFDD